jgi:hypothetical protein
VDGVVVAVPPGAVVAGVVVVVVAEVGAGISNWIDCVTGRVGEPAGGRTATVSVTTDRDRPSRSETDGLVRGRRSRRAGEGGGDGEVAFVLVSDVTDDGGHRQAGARGKDLHGLPGARRADRARCGADRQDAEEVDGSEADPVLQGRQEDLQDRRPVLAGVGDPRRGRGGVVPGRQAPGEESVRLVGHLELLDGTGDAAGGGGGCRRRPRPEAGLHRGGDGGGCLLAHEQARLEQAGRALEQDRLVEGQQPGVRGGRPGLEGVEVGGDLPGGHPGRSGRPEAVQVGGLHVGLHDDGEGAVHPRLGGELPTRRWASGLDGRVDEEDEKSDHQADDQPPPPTAPTGGSASQRHTSAGA